MVISHRDRTMQMLHCIMIFALSACGLPRGSTHYTLPRSELASAFAQCEAERIIEQSPGQYYVIACDRIAIYSCDAVTAPEDSECTRIAVGDPAVVLPEDRSPAAIKDKANRLFEFGRELYKEGRHLEACNLLSESDALLRTPGSAANLGNCEEIDGHPERAWELYDAVAHITGRAADEPLVRFARSHASAIAAKLCTLIITLPDPTIAGLTVRVGPRMLAPAATIRTVVAPAEIDVVVAAPNVELFRQTVHGAAGASIPIVVPTNRTGLAPPVPQDEASGLFPPAWLFSRSSGR